MMHRIDSHLHINFHGQSAEDVVRSLADRGVDQGWVLTWEETDSANPVYQEITPEAVLEACDRYRGILLPWCAPDPAVPGAVDRLRQYHARGCVGCGELKTRLRWDDQRLDCYLETVAELGFPLIFHMEAPQTLIRPRHILDRVLLRLGFKPGGACSEFPGYLPDFDGLAQRFDQFPSIQFVGHGPLFWKGIDHNWEQEEALFPDTPVSAPGITVQLLEKYPNMNADLSGRSGYNALARDPIFATRFIDRFQDRILYGTDNMDLGLMQLLRSLDLPGQTLDKVFGTNAERLLNSKAKNDTK